GNLNQDQKLGGRTLAGISLFVGLVFAVFAASAQPLTTSRNTNQIRIVELQGTVEISPAGATTWVLTQTNQVLYPHDRLRTGANSRVALRWADESVVPFGASTELEVLPPDAADAQPDCTSSAVSFHFFIATNPDAFA